MSTSRKSRSRAISPDSAQCTRSVAAIRALVGTMSQSARLVEQRTGLTNAQLFLLKQLAREGPLSVNDLAVRAMTRQSTVSILATRLETAGLLERTRSADDGRRVMLALSAAGRRLLKRAPEPPLADLIGALCRMTPGELEALDLGLDAVLRELGIVAAAAPPMFERPVARVVRR